MREFWNSAVLVPFWDGGVHANLHFNGALQLPNYDTLADARVALLPILLEAFGTRNVSVAAIQEKGPSGLFAHAVEIFRGVSRMYTRPAFTLLDSSITVPEALDLAFTVLPLFDRTSPNYFFTR